MLHASPGCFVVAALDKTSFSSLVSVACALFIVCGISESAYNAAKIGIVAFGIRFAVHLWNAARLYCPRCCMEHGPQIWRQPQHLLPSDMGTKLRGLLSPWLMTFAQEFVWYPVTPPSLFIKHRISHDVVTSEVVTEYLSTGDIAQKSHIS